MYTHKPTNFIPNYGYGFFLNFIRINRSLVPVSFFSSKSYRCCFSHAPPQNYIYASIPISSFKVRVFRFDFYILFIQLRSMKTRRSMKFIERSRKKYRSIERKRIFFALPFQHLMN